MLSGGRLGPFCHLDPSGQAGGLVGGNVSFRQGKWGQPSSSIPGHSPVLLLSGPLGLPVPRPQCPTLSPSRLNTLHPPCPAPWSFPGSELATPCWTLWPSLALGRAQWPSLALPARPPAHHPARPRCPSEEAAVLQVVLDDDVGDGVEHELHVLGVGGAREVRVDLLGVLALVQVLELALDVAGCLVVLVGPWGGRQNGEDSCYVCGRWAHPTSPERVLCV